MLEKNLKRNLRRDGRDRRNSRCGGGGGGFVVANGIPGNPSLSQPAAAAAAQSKDTASCAASDRLLYEELSPSAEIPNGICLNHRGSSSSSLTSSSPRLTWAALVATAALVVGLVAVVAVGVVLWHDHQRLHHHQPQLGNGSLVPLTQEVRKWGVAAVGTLGQVASRLKTASTYFWSTTLLEFLSSLLFFFFPYLLRKGHNDY